MTAKSLFNIILKVFGIYLLKDIIIAIPTLLGSLYSLASLDINGAFVSFLISAFTILIYVIVIYYLIFRTDLIIEKFRLLDKIPEDPVPLNIHRSTALSITILIVGLFLIVQAIPLLIRGIAKWYQYHQAVRRFYTTIEPFDFSMILVYVAEIIVGLLLIGNQRIIVNYIELKQRTK